MNGSTTQLIELFHAYWPYFVKLSENIIPVAKTLLTYIGSSYQFFQDKTGFSLVTAAKFTGHTLIGAMNVMIDLIKQGLNHIS